MIKIKNDYLKNINNNEIKKYFGDWINDLENLKKNL
jgi:hypothetical protein